MVSRLIAATAALVMASAVLPIEATAQVIEYYHLDALGSIRAVSDQAGQLVERHDYLPYGEECTTPPCASVPGTNTRKFTGKERDAETGLDYFGARYHGSGVARFTTVDPRMDIAGNLAEPQRWNRYAYAQNRPLSMVDPDGRDAILMVWPQTNDVIGHAALAVQNRNAAGEPTGAVTVYHLWPAGEFDESGLRAKGEYRAETVTESDLGKFGGGEGYPAGGMVRIKGTAEQDRAVSDRMKALAATKADYVAPSNTCSTYCKAGVEAAGIPVTQTGTVTAYKYGIPFRQKDVVTPVSVYNSVVDSRSDRVQVMRPLSKTERNPDLTIK